MKDKEKIKALKSVTASRQLRGLNLITEEEFRTIGKRIAEKYGKYLSPIDR